MRVTTKIFIFKNGGMEPIFNEVSKCSKLEAQKTILRWYRKNPYAKRINDEWICSDYRVDQQRPQRNVYSEAYIKIDSMTDMEKRYIDLLIKNLERNREYPTVWDDGKNTYYEETIYCPKCGKRRKVLTSETHCEFCGFEFDKAFKCPKCNGLNLKGSDECRICGFEFRKESFINDNEFKVNKDEDYELIRCPKCNAKKSKYFDSCQECGFDFSNKKQCPKCGKWVGERDKYCGYCGRKLMILMKCNNCGKENEDKNRYCNYCGKKL